MVILSYLGDWGVWDVDCADGGYEEVVKLKVGERLKIEWKDEGFLVGRKWLKWLERKLIKAEYMPVQSSQHGSAARISGRSPDKYRRSLNKSQCTDSYYTVLKPCLYVSKYLRTLLFIR